MNRKKERRTPNLLISGVFKGGEKPPKKDKKKRKKRRK
jgi:hypothetical protein